MPEQIRQTLPHARQHDLLCTTSVEKGLIYIEEDRVDVGSVGHLGRTQRVSGIDVSIGLDVRLHVVRRITFARAITSMLVDGDSA